MPCFRTYKTCDCCQSNRETPAWKCNCFSKSRFCKSHLFRALPFLCWLIFTPFFDLLYAPYTDSMLWRSSDNGNPIITASTVMFATMLLPIMVDWSTRYWLRRLLADLPASSPTGHDKLQFCAGFECLK